MQILIILTLIFLIARLLVAAYNYHNSPRLRLSRLEYGELISILVPARNEARNLPGLLNSLLALEGVRYEIIVLDDHSQDETFRIASNYAAQHPAIQVISGNPLPEGWTGKNYACWQLAQKSSGEYLLFIDADVQLHPAALSSALHQLKRKKLALLSLFSGQELQSFGEKVTVPLMNYLLLTLLPLRLIADHPDPVFSAACGQFMLFTAHEYRQNEWHQQLRDIVAEDLGIMKALKQSGLKGEGLMAGSMVSCRMYESFGSAVQGFSKNLIAPFNDSLWLFVPFVSTILLGPLLIIGSGNPYLFSLLLLIIGATRIYSSRLAGERCWDNLLLHPIQMISFLLISTMAIRHQLFDSAIWKGRDLSPQRKKLSVKERPLRALIRF